MAAQRVTRMVMAFLAAFVNGVELLVHYPQVFFRQWWWYTWGKPREMRRLRRRKQEATSFQEWEETALKLDKISGMESWKSQPRSRFYDAALITQRLAFLKEIMRSGDVYAMMFHLRAGMLRNFGGITNPHLFQRTHLGTKHVIEEYTAQVIEQLEHIYSLDDSVLPLDIKSEFFAASYQTYGRSALVLHGTVAFAIFQLGIIKALHEHDMLPKVICGSSAGALVAALVCCKTDQELPTIFQKGGLDFAAFLKRDQKGRFKRRIKRLIQHGVLMDIKIVEQALCDNIGNMTFQEAYHQTGRLLNITLRTKGGLGTPRLLNYLNAPNVIIWSAACASCSVVGLYEDVDILAKNNDGEIIKWNPEGVTWAGMSNEGDFQITRLSELFFVNHFIVSRVLPYETPFIANTMGEYSVIQKFFQLIRAEIKHRMQQLDEFRLLPAIFKSMFNIYGGDISIVPKLNLADYTKMFSLPTGDFVQHCILQGERATWPLLSLIKTRVGIEKRLEVITQVLKREREAAVLQRELNAEEEGKAGKLEKRRMSNYF